MYRLFIAAIIGLIFSGCSRNGAEETAVTTDTLNSDSVASGLPNFSDTMRGIRGVMDVPEMITLAIKDSCTMEEAPFKVGHAYSAIEADIKALKLESIDQPGALYYTNDPKHLVFECVIPIVKIPNEKPKNSTIVILEATRAVLYNYYGSYDKLNTAYDKIKIYMQENNLQQSSPAREFYLSDAVQEKDPDKWLTKVYIPVK
jgi:effector-binding domain-containing protein